MIEPPAAPSREEPTDLVRSLHWWDQRIYLGRGAGFKYCSTPIYLTTGRILVAGSKSERSLLDLTALE